MKTPQKGGSARYSLDIGAAHTIGIGRGQEMVTVLSTPSMILAMELAAKKLLKPYLDEGDDSVGVTVDVEHLAPTPAGGRIEAEATYLGANGSFHDFEVSAHDGAGVIGKGRHRRAVVPLTRFTAALARRHTVGNSDSERSSGEPPFGKSVKLDVNGAIATLRLQREHALNAIDRSMTVELEAILDTLESRYPEIRVCLIKGAGRAFCAGEDIKENASLNADDSLELATRRSEICQRLSRLPQLFIAQVHGACMGGGMALAMSCDFIAASHDARFSMPEIKLGWPPAYAMEHLLSRLGRSTAQELALTGRIMTASEALSKGLLWKVLASSVIEKEIRVFAESLLAHSPEALKATVLLLRKLSTVSKDPSPELQLLAYHQCRCTDNAKIGMRRFIEKNHPLHA